MTEPLPISTILTYPTRWVPINNAYPRTVKNNLKTCKVQNTGATSIHHMQVFLLFWNVVNLYYNQDASVKVRPQTQPQSKNTVPAHQKHLGIASTTTKIDLKK